MLIKFHKYSAPVGDINKVFFEILEEIFHRQQETGKCFFFGFFLPYEAYKAPCKSN